MPAQFGSIFYRIALTVIVEINPCLFRFAGGNFCEPRGKFFVGIRIIKPTLRPVKADVNVIGGDNQIVWQFWCADGAENDFVRPKRRENFRRPPARMAKFQNVPISRIELRQN